MMRQHPSFPLHIEIETTYAERPAFRIVVVSPGPDDSKSDGRIGIMLAGAAPASPLINFALSPHEALQLAAALREAWDAFQIGPAASVMAAAG